MMDRSNQLCKVCSRFLDNSCQLRTVGTLICLSDFSSFRVCLVGKAWDQLNLQGSTDQQGKESVYQQDSSFQQSNYNLVQSNLSSYK
jgi:hypothetical protein